MNEDSMRLHVTKLQAKQAGADSFSDCDIIPRGFTITDYGVAVLHLHCVPTAEIRPPPPPQRILERLWRIASQGSKPVKIQVWSPKERFSKVVLKSSGVG